MSTYIVIADATTARVFARNGKGTALEVANFVHPEIEFRTGDLRPSSNGETIYVRSGESRQPVNESAATEKHTAFFAKKLSGYLQDVRVNRQADELVLAAAPQLLAALRENLDAKTRELLTRTVEQDLSTAPYAALQEHLETL